MNDPPTQRLCKKFVVRPSGGSLYLGFRLITNFRLKAELRTSCFYTVSQLVDRSYSTYKKDGHTQSPQSHQRSWWIVHTQPTKRTDTHPVPESHQLRWWDYCKKMSKLQPPTALVGFENERARQSFCRLSMNDPPTALVGFWKPH